MSASTPPLVPPSGLASGLALVLMLCLALGVLAGCGLGAGPTPGGVELLVTRDFGARELASSSAPSVRELASSSAPSVRGEETVMSLLERNARVSTRYGGGFVQSIDGLSGGREGGAPVDWFYYVNGVEAPLGAASTVVHGGDHIWWDRHDWSQTENVPAVVGSFPEPFLHGIEGKRLPVRVECAAVGGAACGAVARALHAAGVPAGIAALGGGGPHTLSVQVAAWPLIVHEQAAHQIDTGPRASGVYATMSADGRTLTLLDQDGARRRALTGAAGLIAATRVGEEAPTWFVTGTSEAGVALAAGAFNAATLDGRFALAVTSAGTQALPLISG